MNIYMMLGRLQMDCQSYLMNRNSNRLWAKCPTAQIEKMEELYSSLPEDKKPEWLTWEEIQEYKKQMLQEV